MNTAEFRAIMMKHGDTVKELAEVLNIHPKTLYYKYSGCGNRCEFTLAEVRIIKRRYNLSAEDVSKIFLE